MQKALCPWAVHTKLSQITPQQAFWAQLYCPFSLLRILNQKTLEQKGPWRLNLSPTLQMGVEEQAGREGEASQGITSPLRVLRVPIPAQGSQVGMLLGFSHTYF